MNARLRSTFGHESHGGGVWCSVQELFNEGQKSRGCDLHLKKRSRASQSGMKRSSIRGRGMEFFESRPYVAQDEIRNIDWKVSARLNQLFTKVYVEERDRPIYFVVDLSGSMFFGSNTCFKSVLACKIAARLAAAAINGGDQIGGIIFNEAVRTECLLKSGHKNLARLMGMLSVGSKAHPHNLTNDRSKLFSTVLKQVANRLHPGVAVFLISDFLGIDDRVRQILYRIKVKADVFALSISDPLEDEIPAIGAVGMSDGNHELFFDSNDAHIKNNYQSLRKDQHDRLAALFNSLGIPLIEFSTAVDPTHGLKRIFSGKW